MPLPITHIATGIGETVLCLQLHRDYIWAGLYPSQAAGAPLEIGVAHRRTGARQRASILTVGSEAFEMAAEPLRQAVLWLDRHDVRVRTSRAAAQAGAA